MSVQKGVHKGTAPWHKTRWHARLQVIIKTSAGCSACLEFLVLHPYGWPKQLGSFQLCCDDTISKVCATSHRKGFHGASFCCWRCFGTQSQFHCSSSILGPFLLRWTALAMRPSYSGLLAWSSQVLLLLSSQLRDNAKGPMRSPLADLHTAAQADRHHRQLFHSC